MRKLWASAASLGLISALFAGCGGGSTGAAPTACEAHADCNDHNPCTFDHCGSNGFCAHEGVSNAIPDDEEIGDCRYASCMNGAVSYAPDPSDIPDDEEPCTEDQCDGVVPRNIPESDGSSCATAYNNGECHSGQCVVLCTEDTAETQCYDGDGCTEDECVRCDDSICNGDGKCKNTPVEGDGPDDGNDCTEDLCTDGEQTHDPYPEGHECNGDSVCDEFGQCVACDEDSDCPDPGVLCYEPACDAGFCTSRAMAQGSEVPAAQQIVGDCNVYTCDGFGSYSYTADDDDIADDANACTTDSCVFGTPSHVGSDPGTSCGEDGAECNGAGYCCTPFVYNASSYFVALRNEISDTFTDAQYLTLFDAGTGIYSDLGTMGFTANQVAYDPSTGLVYYVTNSEFGMLQDCGQGVLEGRAQAVSNAVTPLSQAKALTFDTTDEELLLTTIGGAGILYSYDLASTWAEVASMESVDVSASTYAASDDRLYFVDGLSWQATLRPYSTAGVVDTPVSLAPTIDPPISVGETRVQLRAANDYVYYIVHGRDTVSTWYTFVRVDPSDGTATTLYP